jgi:hypothetical protein
MSSLLQLLEAAIAAGDTAEGIAQRAQVAGDTVRRALRGEGLRAESQRRILRVVTAGNDSAQALSPLLAREIAWAEETLVGFSREYAARIAEALGATMAAVIRQPAPVATSPTAAAALLEAASRLEAPPPASTRPAPVRRRQHG